MNARVNGAERQCSGTKYHRRIKPLPNGLFDVYAVLDAYDVKCPARQHAIKKLLLAGLRGKASELKDLEEAMDAVRRAIEICKSKAVVCDESDRNVTHSARREAQDDESDSSAELETLANEINNAAIKVLANMRSDRDEDRQSQGDCSSNSQVAVPNSNSPVTRHGFIVIDDPNVKCDGCLSLSRDEQVKWHAELLKARRAGTEGAAARKALRKTGVHDAPKLTRNTLMGNHNSLAMQLDPDSLCQVIELPDEIKETLAKLRQSLKEERKVVSVNPIRPQTVQPVILVVEHRPSRTFR